MISELETAQGCQELMCHAMWVLSKHLLCKPRSTMYLLKPSPAEGTYAASGIWKFLQRSVHTGLSTMVIWEEEATWHRGTWVLVWGLPLSCLVNSGHVVPFLDPFALSRILWLQEEISVVFCSANYWDDREGAGEGGGERVLCTLAVSVFCFFHWVNFFFIFPPAQASLFPGACNQCQNLLRVSALLLNKS